MGREDSILLFFFIFILFYAGRMGRGGPHPTKQTIVEQVPPCPVLQHPLSIFKLTHKKIP